MVILDGGLATSLARLGLPQFTPVEPWVLTHPERVSEIQRSFVDAGSQLLLTPTFRSLPSESQTWRRSIEAGVALSGEAAGEAEVWLCLGPGEGHLEAVSAAGDVHGVLLETFTDAARALQTLRAVLTVGHPVVVSLVPTVDGGLPCGESTRHTAERLLDAGATGVGFNCMPGPAVVNAVRAVPPHVPVWAKPGGGALQAAAWDALASRVTWMGGCCGTSPAAIRRLSARWGD